MKESHAKLQAVPNNTVEHKSESSGVDYTLLANDSVNHGLINHRANSIITTESSKNVQHFHNIRDPFKSMVCLIDTMFDYLQAYADESNKGNSDPQLSLHWQRPTLETSKVMQSWLNTPVDLTTFTGKLYTCNWSLIVKGTSELVTSYIIPADRVISFNSEPEIYTPYLKIYYVKKGANFNWQIEGESITDEHIPKLTRKLLERLMKSARSQEWARSVFCLQPIEGRLALDQAADACKNLNEKTDDPEQFLIDLMNISSKRSALKNDELKAVIEISNAGEFQITADISTDIPADIASPNQTLEEALKSLSDILVRQLAKLTEEGGDAFSRHDLKSAQDILTLSNQISELKNKVEEIMVSFKIQH